MTETESFTTVFCCDCSTVYPGLLLAITARAQATSSLEKNFSRPFLRVISCLAEIILRVIYVLLQSDWLAQNLELEPLNPGMSALMNFSFLVAANIRTRMHIRGRIRQTTPFMIFCGSVVCSK